MHTHTHAHTHTHTHTHLIPAAKPAGMNLPDMTNLYPITIRSVPEATGRGRVGGGEVTRNRNKGNYGMVPRRHRGDISPVANTSW